MLKTSQTHRKDKEIETRLSNLYKNRAAKLNKMLETNKKLKKDQEQKLSMRIGMEKTQKEELIERLIQKNKRVEMMRQKHSIAFQKSK
ncbi:unnamed protein product [Moneuplotes crassus]|uniref:Uncharacterized protein n=1 Tax=Euplotes crassus TaxID=5936 RepID=A0AAD1XBI8_EUPCR|nr:unnamed protein product [Moneuplotes crassus]